MSANHLTDGKTHLEIAIDAQHGGFPSRLLDVTYNCLVALYFAITPYYTESETSHDNEDGIVYIFFLEDIYCPTGNNINQAYNACLQQKLSRFFPSQFKAGFARPTMILPWNLMLILQRQAL